MRGWGSILLTSILSVGAARAADSPDGGFGPDVLARLARSVVKVRSGDDWQTGFVFGTPRNVVTSYFVANESSTLTVVTADQKGHEARVVAWSEVDDLAVLELAEPVAAPPLTAASEVPWTPEPIAVLYQPKEADSDSKEAKTWSVPVVMLGHVGRVLPNEIDIDVSLWGRPGDYGAPVVTQSGQVVGIVSHSKKRRSTATRAERLQRLLPSIGKQGEFERSHDVSMFGGAQLSPIAGNRTVGGGLVVGLEYRWFVLEGVLGFYQRGYRPIDSTRFEAMTRLQSEIFAEIQIKFGPGGGLFFGPCAQFNHDFIDTLTVTGAGTVSDSRYGGQILPGGTIGLWGGPLFYRVELSAQPRFDIGFVFGR